MGALGKGYPAGMKSRNQPSLNRLFADVQYNRLDAILRCLSGKDAVTLEEMDRFFAALVSEPVTVPPSVYLNGIWGEGQSPFATESDLGELLNLAMHPRNFVARTMGSGWHKNIAPPRGPHRA